MIIRNQNRAAARFVLALMLMAGMYGLAPTRVGAEASAEPVWQEEDCQPGSGWMWTPGPLEPEVALQARQELSRQGIDAIVEARGYGETDGCDYQPYGIDFTVALSNTPSMHIQEAETLAEDVRSVLEGLGGPNLGNVKLFSAQGELIPVNVPEELPVAQAADAAALADPITRQVYVIVYDPLLSSGLKLSEHMHWNSHAAITQQTVDFFSQTTNGRLDYTVVNTTVVNNWPELVDGFTYTEQQYLAVLSNPASHHSPTGVNYNKIVNAPEFDICGKLNRGEIDEVWIYNAPWFGFYESTLVGPGSYWFNSSPVPGPHTCNKILPIMGPSVERTVDEAVHNFTHRTESTMMKVYGSWQENNISHSWNKFGLVKAQSPDYSYSGCGSGHYPPNGTSDYNYANSSEVLSNCHDFANYPNLGDPLVTSQPVSCAAWGCSGVGYYGYWFGHMPAAPGCGPDNVANDWWTYIIEPGTALYPSAACQPDLRVISGNAGVAGAVLAYTDGGPKSVMADNYGNYFLVVSNHWSGRVTPSRLSYSFTPAYLEYVDVQSDLSAQNYAAEQTSEPTLYVNIATGNNGNSCITPTEPCRNIQETINKASAGDTIRVASGTYQFSVNPSPNVVIINKGLKLSGGWNSDFTLQDGVSVIDGATINNGILSLSSTVTVENFVIERSKSHNSGAIYIGGGNFTLSRSTLQNNVANSNGAGIFIDNGVLSVINSTISGNRAGGMGGGIYTNNGTAAVTIKNSTIAYNSATLGGGGLRRVSGTYNLTNTIIANNSSPAAGPDCSGTIAAANFNIIENMSGCSITSGSNNLNVDPQISVSLTGDRPLHALFTGSPAVDAGDDATCPGADQRGTARPYGSHCDIGALETAPHSISGNTGLAGAVLAYADGVDRTATADANGDYSFTVLTGWSGAVTPSGAGYAFSPASTAYSNVIEDQTAQDYTAASTVVSFTISGNAGTGGAALQYVDGTTKTVTADANGDYSFTVPENWSGTLTPSKAGYRFTPVNRSFDPVQMDQPNQVFTAQRLYTISGNTGIASAALDYTDGTPKTEYADELGNYSLQVPENWSGPVMPSKPGYVFVPVGYIYPNLDADQNAQDYLAIALYTISGNAGVKDAALSYMEDGVQKIITADADGNYSFVVKAGWEGTVTPAREGVVFDPPGRTYNNVQADQTSQNYSTALLVSNSADSGPGSLRQAIADAVAGSRIMFDPALAGQTIMLESDLTIGKSLTVDGSGLSPQLTISGGSIAHIEIDGVTPPTVTITDLTIAEGYTAGDGGAIFSNGDLILVNCTLRDNHALGDGGAVYSYKLTVRNTTVHQNQADSGGGAFAFVGTAADYTIVNSTVAHNQAGIGGGAIYMDGYPEADVYNSTFAANYAPEGREIMVMGGSLLGLHNTMFICSSTDSASCYAHRGTAFIGSMDSILGLGTLADFGLAELAHNGGPTQTMAL
ncbi:MAG: choice-of-anchor Q domain-containing protein, partial [Anaerolineales bacterium]